MEGVVMARTRLWFAGTVALLAWGCTHQQEGGKAGANAGVVKGTVAYRERMALPPDAVIEVWMTDITPGLITTMQVLGQATIPAEGRQVPIPFELSFDPARIEPTHTYGLRAAINASGQMLFESDAPMPVITQGNSPEVSLVLKRSSPDPAAGAASLANTSWRLTDLGGTPVLPDAEATLEFPEPGKVAGHGSCNRFAGTVEFTGDRLQVGRLAATRMACAEPITVQETKYLQALQEAERFGFEGGGLVIHCKGMGQPLRFTPRS